MKTTMKRLMAAVVAGVLVMGTAQATGIADVNDNPFVISAEAASNYVKKSKVKKIVLKDAGLSSKSISEYEIELEEGKNPVYEVEFISGGYQYGYDVVAKTGKIKEMSCELIDKTSIKTKTRTITVSAAKKKALKEAGKSSKNVKKLKCSKKTDDGLKLYKVTFRAGGYRYEYELDVYSGRVVEMEKELIK